MSIHMELDLEQVLPFLILAAVLVYLLLGVLLTKILLVVDKAYSLHFFVRPDGSEVDYHFSLVVTCLSWLLWVPVLLVCAVCCKLEKSMTGFFGIGKKEDNNGETHGA